MKAGCPWGLSRVESSVLRPGHPTGQVGGSRTWPESRQGAVLVQPSQRGLTEALQACRGHHPVEGLKQRPDEDAELAQVKEQACCPASILTRFTCSPDIWPKPGERPGVSEALNPKDPHCSRPLILTRPDQLTASAPPWPFFWAGRSHIPRLPALAQSRA